MNKIKATLNLAPKTHDEDYERRKASLKELSDAIHTYKSAMTKVQASMKSAMEALGQVNKAFDKLTDDSDTNAQIRDLAQAFSASYDRITGDYYAEYSKTMDSEVVGGMNTLKTLYDQCSRIESERNKMRSEYDVYREDVSKKEAEYAKKGKDLSTSKSYSSNIAKRDDYKGRYETEDEKYKSAHDELLSQKASTVLACIDNFFKCSQGLYNGLDSEFTALHGTSLKLL